VDGSPERGPFCQHNKATQQQQHGMGQRSNNNTACIIVNSIEEHLQSAPTSLQLL
jgi:hypothetical protein